MSRLPSTYTYNFSSELAALIAKGELLPIVMMLYRPDEDMLELIFPPTITKEEALAMLEKFGLTPSGRWST